MYVRFCPKADKSQIVSVCPLSADIVAEAGVIKAARLALHFRNGSHHSPFAER
jgi:hypothetical protein